MDNRNSLIKKYMKDIENGKVVIAEEGILDFFNEVIVAIDDSIKSGLLSIKEFFKKTTIEIDNEIEYRTKTPFIVDLYKMEKKIVRYITEDDFNKYKDLEAPTMPGFDLTIRELILILNKDKLKTLVKDINENLSKFKNTLNKVYENNINSYEKLNTEEIKIKLNQAEKEFSNIISTKIIKDRKPIKELISNFIELKENVRDTIKLGADYNMENLEYTSALNKEIYELLDKLMNDDDIKNSNNEPMIKLLSEDLSLLAKYNTIVGYIYFLHHELVLMNIGVIDTIEAAKENNDALVDRIVYHMRSAFNNFFSIFK